MNVAVTCLVASSSVDFVGSIIDVAVSDGVSSGLRSTTVVVRLDLGESNCNSVTDGLGECFHVDSMVALNMSTRTNLDGRPTNQNRR